MIDYIIHLLLCLFENIIIIQIIDTMLEIKNFYIKYMIVIILTLCAAFINTYQYPFMLIFIYLVLLLYCCMNYTDSIKRKIFISLSVFGLNIFLASGLILITSLLKFNILANDYLYYSLVIVQKILLITIFIPFKKVYLRFNWTNMILEMIAGFICILCIFYGFVSKSTDTDITILLLIIFSLMFLINVYICFKYGKEKLKNQSLLIQNHYIGNTSASLLWHKSFNHWIHDLRTETIQLRLALEEKDIDKALVILNNTIFDNSLFVSKTSNETLNYALDNKVTLMSIKDIQFNMIVQNDLAFLKDEDLIILIDSLMSYAIELHPLKIDLQIINAAFGVKVILQYDPNFLYSKIRNNFLIEELKDIVVQYKGTLNIEKDCVKICFFREDDNEQDHR